MIRGDVFQILKELEEDVPQIGWKEHNNGYIVHLQDRNRSSEELQDLRLDVLCMLTEIPGYGYPVELNCSGTFSIFFCFNGVYDPYEEKLYLQLLNEDCIISNINENSAISVLEKFGCPYKIIE